MTSVMIMMMMIISPNKLKENSEELSGETNADAFRQARQSKSK